MNYDKLLKLAEEQEGQMSELERLLDELYISHNETIKLLEKCKNS